MHGYPRVMPVHGAKKQVSSHSDSFYRFCKILNARARASIEQDEKHQRRTLIQHRKADELFLPIDQILHVSLQLMNLESV